MNETPNLAIFCDFENIAIGVRDAKFSAFDIHLVLERLLDKGRVLVKKAYCDWERYKGYKRPMHEAAFELLEVPHVSYSGKNSADIHMCVDALDLCYTRTHIDTFVILSGDSDFSPLVRKLRENDKRVVGLGVKQSSSNLLIENCDEFIYYDDLVRRKKGGHRSTKPGGRGKSDKKKDKPASGSAGTTVAPSSQPQGADGDDKLGDVTEAFDFVLDTLEALFQEREGNVWGSMVKQVLKRKRPNFDESYYGFATFSQLLESARDKGLLVMERDTKSGGYVISGFGEEA